MEWKLGGTSTTPDSDTEYLEIVGDPLGEFCAQHHATLTASDTVVLFDNGTFCLGPRKTMWPPVTRVVEYDISSGTKASFVRQFKLASKYGFASFFGGVTVLDNGHWLIAWGSKEGTVPVREAATISEVDPATGSVLFRMNLSRSGTEFLTYRAYREPEADVHIPLSLP